MGSSALNLAFTALVMIVTIGGVLAFRWAAPREESRDQTLRWVVGAAVVSIAWLALTGRLAAAGSLRFGPLPPPLMLLVALSTVVSAALVFSRVGDRILNAPLWLLIGYQAFRIPVELCLHQACAEGLIPDRMTFMGANFDIITGLSAIGVGYLAFKGRLPRWAAHAWNLMGFALLMTIVVISILSAPVPFRVFFDGPANIFVAEIPFVWLPLVLVQAAFVGHLLVFRKLRQADGIEPVGHGVLDAGRHPG